MKKNFEEEVLHLNNTKTEFRQMLNHTKKRIDNLPSMIKDNPFQLADLLYRANHKLKLMTNNLEKPYFARIDFVAEDGKKEICYIGKVGVSNDENKIITVDWRAPIAAVYYDSNVGDSSYEAPSGVIKGNLKLKRQFEIEEGNLKNYQDIDTVANDEMLKPYLNTNADNRLKNIVSTIQAEQNEIIRQSINKNIVVQGVAGSGKTTVALHRVAYLIYNNIEKIKPDEYLVIGPNNFFVNYISNILPDLDSPEVKQLTYFDLVKDLLDEKLILLSDEKNLSKYISEFNINNFNFYRNSMKYKIDIDKYIDKFKEDLLPKGNLEIKGYQIISKQKMINIYNEVNDQDIYSKKIEKVIARTIKYINDNQIRILMEIRNNFYLKEENEKTKQELLLVEKELKTKVVMHIKKYYKGANQKILKLYIDFLEKTYETEEVKSIIKHLKKKEVEAEDLPALLYFNYKLFGSGNYEKYKHTVVDEAQDYGDFSFYALKKTLSKSTFSIFGDLSQGIYSYKSIENWEYILNNVFENCDLKKLQKSYRTTKEIMLEANKITRYLKLYEAQPVIRHGDEVKYIKINNLKENLITLVKNNLEKKHKTIAIITKDEKESISIYELLKESEVDAKVVTDLQNEYNENILIIPSYLSKGLEFDSVIISDLSKYKEESKIDLLLLYVAMTRAHHNLDILYKDNVASFLEVKND